MSTPINGTALPHIDVRYANPEDTPHLAGILKVMASQTYPGKLPSNVLAALTKWLTSDNPRHRFVADTGGGVIGHIQINSTPTIAVPEKLRAKNAVEVARLFVHPGHRNQGVATALLSAVENTLISEGLTGYLGVPATQRAADYLVTSRNWRPIGTHRGPSDGDTITLYQSPNS